MQRDDYRGYNGYVLERNNRRIIFAGDTALTDSFAELRRFGPIDLAIMPIGAYNPWIHSHCTPEQAVQMANEAGAHFIMPVHHQTFRLSFEAFREPIERFQAALRETPERIALREIGETLVFLRAPPPPPGGAPPAPKAPVSVVKVGKAREGPGGAPVTNLPQGERG